jgi:hypothetical protein
MNIYIPYVFRKREYIIPALLIKVKFKTGFPLARE